MEPDRGGVAGVIQVNEAFVDRQLRVMRKGVNLNHRVFKRWDGSRFIIFQELHADGLLVTTFS
ncbi:Uncharacterised protein [Enterobacter cloacae]|nr:Uncharacterised protein [Enterobacter cloacae]